MNPAVRYLLLSPRWTPSRLFAAGEQGGWWDPSDFSTMFQDSAGTTPVTATGQPVGLIRDKSGRGNHRTQGTAASRPTLQQDASGFYYLQYDGVDDWMQTASVDFSGTDKVAVVVGIRKETDAAIGAFLELTANSSSTAGSFGLFAPPTGAEPRYNFRSGGSAPGIGATSPATFAAPVSNVVTGTANIAGDSVVLRANGAVVGREALDQGTGSFSNASLFFGRRGGTTLPFTGREYQTIVLGRSANATEIARAERFVGQRMGISL